MSTTSSTSSTKSTKATKVAGPPDTTADVVDVSYHINAFWLSLTRQWEIIYKALTEGTDSDRSRVLDLLNFFAGPLTNNVSFEITVGEINRIAFPSSGQMIELYISVNLLKSNVPIMEEFYAKRMPCKNLTVFKYRSYNVKDPILTMIEYPDCKYTYDDFGCQSFHTLDKSERTVRPIINLVIYVKKDAAATLLEKKNVTFHDPDRKDAKPIELEKWLPVKTNVIDLLLCNIIGEYHLVHSVGYIEFLPEGDPLIAAGSVFTELSDLRGDFAILDKHRGMQSCATCTRRGYQTDLKQCGRCHESLYCCVECQRIDWTAHKTMCKSQV